MNRTEFFQALTLWFVAATFLQVDGNSDGAVVTVAAIVALGLLYLLPMYLLLGIGREILVEYYTTRR